MNLITNNLDKFFGISQTEIDEMTHKLISLETSFKIIESYKKAHGNWID